MANRFGKTYFKIARDFYKAKSERRFKDTEEEGEVLKLMKEAKREKREDLLREAQMRLNELKTESEKAKEEERKRLVERTKRLEPFEERLLRRRVEVAEAPPAAEPVRTVKVKKTESGVEYFEISEDGSVVDVKNVSRPPTTSEGALIKEMAKIWADMVPEARTQYDNKFSNFLAGVKVSATPEEKESAETGQPVRQIEVTPFGHTLDVPGEIPPEIVLPGAGPSPPSELIPYTPEGGYPEGVLNDPRYRLLDDEQKQQEAIAAEQLNISKTADSTKARTTARNEYLKANKSALNAKKGKHDIAAKIIGKPEEELAEEEYQRNLELIGGIRERAALELVEDAGDRPKYGASAEEKKKKKMEPTKPKEFGKIKLTATEAFRLNSMFGTTAFKAGGLYSPEEIDAIAEEYKAHVEKKYGTTSAGAADPQLGIPEGIELIEE